MPDSKDLLPVPRASSVPAIVRRLAPTVLVGAGVAVLALTGLLRWAAFVAALGFVGIWIRGVWRRLEASATAPQENDPVKQLERALSRCQYMDGFEGPGSRGLSQLNQLIERRKVFMRILNERLDPSELTFARYREAVELAVQGVLDALKRVVEELNTLTSQNAGYTDERLKALAALASPSDSDRTELEALQARQAIRTEHLERVSGILTGNEVALTEFDRTTSAISGMKAGTRLTASDLDAALKDLQEIAARARKFEQH